MAVVAEHSRCKVERASASGLCFMYLIFVVFSVCCLSSFIEIYKFLLPLSLFFGLEFQRLCFSTSSVSSTCTMLFCRVSLLPLQWGVVSTAVKFRFQKVMTFLEYLHKY